jgi:hypothetical protein
MGLSHTLSVDMFRVITGKKCVLMETVNPDMLNDIFNQITKGYDGHMLRDIPRWVEYMNALAQDEVLFYVVIDEKTPIGYLAASETDVEELCLMQEICPTIEGYDFSKWTLPMASGTIPAAMVRIVDLIAFLKSCPMPKNLDYRVKVRFIDPLIDENNVILNLECCRGIFEVSKCKE